MRRRIATAAGLALAAILLLAPAARAQGSVTALGRVGDADGNPLPDVQVRLEYRGHVVQRYRTKTDKNGVFTHVNVYSGPYRVTLKKDGLGERSLDFNIQEIGRLQSPPEFRLVARVQAAPPPPSSGLAPAAAAPGGGPMDASSLAADINTATALSGQGRTDEAIAAYEAILARTPSVPLVHYNLGAAYKRKGNTAEGRGGDATRGRAPRGHAKAGPSSTSRGSPGRGSGAPRGRPRDPSRARRRSEPAPATRSRTAPGLLPSGPPARPSP